MPLFDLAIIGGGINGAAIARDAAGRGHSVVLIEAGDLAGATSSASSKLIHGGLRYLEQHAFRLVAESLAEREILLRTAPHLVQTLPFVLPHQPHLRPAWQIRAGLFLYDHLGALALALQGRRSTMPGSQRVRLAPQGFGAGLHPTLTEGFVYHDCRADDARLVVMNALAAAGAGARILTRTRLIAAVEEEGNWVLTCSGTDTALPLRARVLVNAAGPWVEQVLGRIAHRTQGGRLRLVRGSHIVVPRLHDQPHACILQQPDGRVVFMIPHAGEFTLIGTTDVDMSGAGDQALRTVAASGEEVAYLCAAANRYCLRQISPADVLWTFAGVRGLYDDGTDNPSAVTRDYHLQLDGAPGRGAPLLSVYGGKLTSARRLAERVLARLAPWLGRGRSWTADRAFPGGDFASRPALLAELVAAYPGLPAALLESLVARHGTRVRAVLGQAATTADLGEHFGAGLYEAEVEYFIRHEWACTAEDVLWRRTRHGLLLGPQAAQRLSRRVSGLSR